ncbi:M23 family metallopeptidase [Devosia enhydra]|uniref:M23 family metallopeptidase n=1 Tax=Devosia enhydra TaxID=665118 RepID=UPI001FCD41D3|nr:M23 family metallopeptidase [Devosia enhydra]
MRRSSILVAIASLCLSSVVFAADADILSQGRTLSEAFLEGEHQAVWSRMTDEMQSAFGTLEALAAFREQLSGSLGEETEVLTEEVEQVEGHDVYLRTGRWSEADPDIVMQWALSPEGQVSGFYVRPVAVLAESRFLDYQTKASLRLPFAGEWTLVWGGRSLAENYHGADPAQRFAIDALILRDGVSHEGPADRLESYHCWGEPILAPAAGTVVAAIDGLPDQPIGTMDPHNPAGNHVVLDLGNSEFAFLAHLRAGSVAVAAGDSVSVGDRLGLCGNSGNSS